MRGDGCSGVSGDGIDRMPSGSGWDEGFDALLMYVC